jgi:hypothetical protein
MWGPNPLPRNTKGVEPLTKDSIRDPLTNCTILGPWGKGVIGLFEEAGDGVGCHFRLIVLKNNCPRVRGVFFQTRGAGRVLWRIAIMMINVMVFAKVS